MNLSQLPEDPDPLVEPSHHPYNEYRLPKPLQPPRPFVPQRQTQTSAKPLFRQQISKLQSERDIARHAEQAALLELRKAEEYRLRLIAERNGAISERDAWKRTAATYESLLTPSSEDHVTQELIAAISTVERIRGVTRRIKDEIETLPPNLADGLVLALEHLMQALEPRRPEDHVAYKSTETIPFLVSLVNRWRRTALGFQKDLSDCRHIEKNHEQTLRAARDLQDRVGNDHEMKTEIARVLDVLEDKPVSITPEKQLPFVLHTKTDVRDERTGEGADSSKTNGVPKSRRDQLLAYVPKKRS